MMTVAASYRDIMVAKQGGDITFADMVDEKEALGESEIQKTFEGSTVLLTGGTGFLGKLMIDKLMRCCPKIKMIYLLARPKKNKDIKLRLEEQFSDPLYVRMKKEVPDFMEKIGVIAGDISEKGLGISETDRMIISSEVDIIIHGAATVRFDEPLKTAVQINVRGTKEMFLLARSCNKLKSMVHISTAYSNCPLKHIEERFYESSLSGDKLIDLIETLDEKIINNIAPGLIGDFPNTYTYTKAAAEDIILKYASGLPVAVLRPSIVTGTAKEPVAGWIDNVYGPTGVVVGAGLGLLRVLNCNAGVLADIVPGDMVVNATIAAAWKIARDYPKNCEACPPPDQPPPIYNYVSGEQKPLTWGNFSSLSRMHGFEVCPSQAMYYFFLLLIENKTLYSLCFFFLHTIPAYILDGISVCIGKKPILRKAYTKIGKFSDVISYFANREWRFADSNTRNLHDCMNQADKTMFDFDIKDLDWSEYFYTYVRGCRIYLLKDPLETISDGNKRMKRLRVLHYFICFMLICLLFVFFRSIYNLVYALF